MSVKVVVQKVCDKHDRKYHDHDVVIFNQPDNKKLMKLYAEVKTKHPELIYTDTTKTEKYEYICYYDYAKRWEGNLRKHLPNVNALHTYYILNQDELKHFKNMRHNDRRDLEFSPDDVYFIMYH